MPEFDSCSAVVKGMEKDVLALGNEFVVSSISGIQTAKKCHELIGYSCILTDWPDRGDVRHYLGEANFNFLKLELREWLDPSTSNPGNAWKEDPEVWKGFLQSDGRFNYTYNERFYLKDREGQSLGDQISNVLKLLRREPHSRQAFISIWSPDRDSGSTLLTGPEGRVPCTIGYQLLQGPDERLDLVYFMRSLCVSWNLWNDLYLVTGLYDYLLLELGWNRGVIHMQVGSLHYFD